jgi:hypothetical protein
VGHNSNLLLNISPNIDGMIDDVDMAAYKQLGTWVASTFGQPPRAAVRNLVLTTNTTTLELGSPAARNFSYVSVMEGQQGGQLIWGWTIEGRYRSSSSDTSSSSGSASSWRPLWNGGSIGHKRIVACADLPPPSTTDATEPKTGLGDPPPPAPKSSDVLFVECARANAWVVHATDGTIRTHGSPDAGGELCLTLDGPPSRFQFVSATLCSPAATKSTSTSSSSGGSGGGGQQQWAYPWKAGQPALAFNGTTAPGNAMCIQINGDRPWTDHRAVVWDCADNAADEAVALLPPARALGAVADAAGAHRMQIDMTGDGGPKLCMAVRAGLPPPPPPPSCAGVEALRFTVTELATAVPASLRELAVF